MRPLPALLADASFLFQMAYFAGPSDKELKAAAAKLVTFGFDGLEVNDHA